MSTLNIQSLCRKSKIGERERAELSAHFIYDITISGADDTREINKIMKKKIKTKIKK